MKKWLGKGSSKSRKMTMERAFGPICVVFIGSYLDFKYFSVLRKESKILLRRLRRMQQAKQKGFRCFSIPPGKSLGKEFIEAVETKTGKVGLPLVFVCMNVEVLEAWVNPSERDLQILQLLVSKNK